VEDFRRTAGVVGFFLKKLLIWMFIVYVIILAYLTANIVLAVIQIRLLRVELGNEAFARAIERTNASLREDFRWILNLRAAMIRMLRVGYEAVRDRISTRLG
jgi:hypothetical protein